MVLSNNDKHEGFLLDTNVLVELFSTEQRMPNPNALAWLEEQSAASAAFYISIVSILELYSGAFKYHKASLSRSASARKYKEARAMSDRLFLLCKTIKSAFKESALDLTIDVMNEWTGILGRNTSVCRGNNLSTKECNDVDIGATANLHELSVVTRNEIDFQKMNLRHEIVNPFG